MAFHSGKVPGEPSAPAYKELDDGYNDGKLLVPVYPL